MQGQILTQTMTLAVIGLPVPSIAAKAIQGLLFGVIWSAATFGGIAVGVVIVAALAGYVPARRASIPCWLCDRNRRVWPSHPES
jgi:uncharacterized membrane protein (DUF441 family)